VLTLIPALRPWALALGTPVLVVAGLGHIIQGAVHKKVKSVRGRSSISRSGLRGRSEDRATTTTHVKHPPPPPLLPLSLPSNFPSTYRETLQAEDSEKDEAEYQYSAKLLGYAPDGATILQFCPSSSSPLNPLLSPSAQARIIGTNVNGQVIVAFRDGKATIAAKGCPDDGEKDKIPVLQNSPSAQSVRTEEPPLPRRTTPSIRLEEPLPRRTTPVPPSSTGSTTAVGSSSPADWTSPMPVTVARSDSPPSAGELSSAPHRTRDAMSE